MLRRLIISEIERCPFICRHRQPLSAAELPRYWLVPRGHFRDTLEAATYGAAWQWSRRLPSRCRRYFSLPLELACRDIDERRCFRRRG